MQTRSADEVSLLLLPSHGCKASASAMHTYTTRNMSTLVNTANKQHRPQRMYVVAADDYLCDLHSLQQQVEIQVHFLVCLPQVSPFDIWANRAKTHTSWRHKQEVCQHNMSLEQVFCSNSAVECWYPFVCLQLVPVAHSSTQLSAPSNLVHVAVQDRLTWHWRWFPIVLDVCADNLTVSCGSAMDEHLQQLLCVTEWCPLSNTANDFNKPIYWNQLESIQAQQNIV